MHHLSFNLYPIKFNYVHEFHFLISNLTYIMIFNHPFLTLHLKILEITNINI